MQTQACAVYRLLLSRREQPGHDERFVLVRPLPRMLRNSDAMPFKAVLDAAPHAEHMHIGLELDIGLNQDRTWLLNVTHFNVSLYNVDEWVFRKSLFHLTFLMGRGSATDFCTTSQSQVYFWKKNGARSTSLEKTGEQSSIGC